MGVGPLFQVENLDMSFISCEQVPVPLERGFSYLEYAINNSYRAPGWRSWLSN